MKQKVVIIGVSYSSRLGLARSIGVLGCEITVVAWGMPGKSAKPIDGYSKYVNRWLICRKEEQAFIDLLKDKCVCQGQKVVLIPDCDFSVAMIDLHQDELRPFFLMPNIHQRQGVIVEWSDKDKQKQLARSLGMNVANSTIVEIRDGHYIIPSTIKYPCFPKALASVSGGKAGMFRCDNKQDIERSLRDIISRKTANTRVMIEEYMEIDKEYAVLGVSDGDSVIIPAVIQFVEGSKTQMGIALQGKVRPIYGFEKLIETFKVFILRIGLVGLFDIDFYQSKGEYYFSELNLRFGGSGYAVVKMGVNLPALFVNCLNGLFLEKLEPNVQHDAIYTNERMCYNDLVNGYVSPREFDFYIKTAQILFIKDEDDNRPYKAFHKTVLKAKIKYWVKLMFKWIKR